MPETSVFKFPYPTNSDSPAGPAQIEAAVKKIEEKLLAIELLITGTPSAGQLLIVGGTSHPEYKSVTGDVTFNSSGVATLGSEKVTTAKIKLLAVEAAQIASNAITAAKLASESVETAKIKLLAVTTATLANEAVTTGKIAPGAITAALMAAESVETAAIKNKAVTAAKLAEEAVETAKIKDLAVTFAKLSAALKEVLQPRGQEKIEVMSGGSIGPQSTSSLVLLEPVLGSVVKNIEPTNSGHILVCRMAGSINFEGGGNLKLRSGEKFAAVTGNVIAFVYDSVNVKWYEINRSLT